MDAAVQATPPCDVFQDVSTQTSDQQVCGSADVFPRYPPLISGCLPCRRHHTVLCLSTFLHRWVLAQLPVDIFVQTPIRSVVLHDVAIQLPITEFFAGCIFSNDLLDRQNPCSSAPVISTRSTCLAVATARTRTASPPPPGHPIGSHLHTTHGASVIAAPLRARLRSAISITPPQLPACTIHVGSHHPRSATTGKRSASTALV